MNKEEKELLLRDLCARLPYGVKVERNGDVCEILGIIDDNIILTANVPTNQQTKVVNIKPYFRPMSSMTEEEYEEFCKIDKVMATLLEINKLDIQGTRECHLMVAKAFSERVAEQQNWLNANHFDYRDLITMGLALEAPKNMYDIKTE